MIIGKIGPAFPAEEWINSDDPSAVNPIRHQGMSLRDYFAGKAIIAYYADGDLSNFKDAAIWCYKLADAMLREREEQEE